MASQIPGSPCVLAPASTSIVEPPPRPWSSPLATLTSADVPALVVDPSGLILEANPAAAILYARSEDHLRGASLGSCAVGADQTADALVSEALAQGVSRATLTIHTLPGRSSPLPVTATRVPTEGDGDATVLVTFTDAELAPHLSTNLPQAHGDARLRAAQKVAGVGLWEWEPFADRLVVSNAFSALIGAEPGTDLTMRDALAAMPVEDRALVMQRLDDALIGPEDAFALEYRVRALDGSTRWLQAKCEVVRDENDGSTRIVGATRDVTTHIAAGQERKQAENFWRAAIDSLSAHVAIVDEYGEIIAVNQAWRRFGQREGAASDSLGVNYLDVCSAADEVSAAEAAAGVRAVLAGERDRVELEYPCHGPDRQRWFVMRVTPYQGGGRRWAVVEHEDVTERRAQRAQSLLQAALLDEVNVSVHATDVHRQIVSWNVGAERLFGWTADEAIGQTVDELLFPTGVVVPADVREAVRRGPWTGEIEMARKDGSNFPAYVRTRTVKLLADDSPSIVVVTLDLTERLRSERELRVARDHLRAVTDGMVEGMYSLDGNGRVTYMNKAAHELLGWSFDEVHGRVMHELTHTRRLDGSPLPVQECPIRRAQQGSEVVRVEDDIFIRPDGTEVPVAYTASPLAAVDGTGCVVVFQDITERKARTKQLERQMEKLDMVNRIRDALAGDRLVLYAQPIIELATGLETQRELLLRMREPDGEIIAPGVFLPVAEEFGLITEIDRWVVDRAAEIAGQGLGIELNVSAASISDPTLIPHITSAIERTGADPALMVFEITETALVSDEDEGRRFVHGLHSLGCQVALDDFGTGYGGFTYLKQLPNDHLKIDIEFVRDLTVNDASLNVVQAIVSLARGFGLKTVAEGVEDAEALALLTELGVDYAQGFHISRPAPFLLPRRQLPRVVPE